MEWRVGVLQVELAGLLVWGAFVAWLGLWRGFGWRFFLADFPFSFFECLALGEVVDAEFLLTCSFW
jgi:hypothetical protein